VQGPGVQLSCLAAAVPVLANRPRLPTLSAKLAAARNFFVVLTVSAACLVISPSFFISRFVVICVTK
jgi:hypothetical protein